MANEIKPHIKLPNGDVLFEGDWAKRRDGRVVGPLEHDGGTGENGPWCVDGFWYHSDGKTNTNNGHYSLIAKADPPQVEGVTDSSGCVLCDLGVCDDTPKLEADKLTLWRDMTDAEKGALLLAHHERKVIEVFEVSRGDWVKPLNTIKPAEPKREAVVLWWGNWRYFSDLGPENATHSLTFTLTNGKMPTGTFTNENGETVVVEDME